MFKRPHSTTALATLLLTTALTTPATATTTPPTTYTLRNTNTDACLHHTYGTTQIRLEPCEPVPEQHWELRPDNTTTNITAYDPEKNARGCVAIGDNWTIRYGQCHTTEATWNIQTNPHTLTRLKTQSDLNNNDLYLTETQAGHLAAQPGGTTPSATWTITQVT